MSSEQEENADHLDDPNANSSSAETNQSPEKKDNGLNEHTKPRRRRRGKKRKHKKESAATCEVVNCEGELHVDRVVDCGDSQTWDSDENLSCDVNTFTDVIIRPVNVPKAPENSTQFIMDDHNDCHFYMSFETPNPYLADPPHHDGGNDVIVEPGEDAAYRDIDWQYESPQDFDNTAYYDREFELSYKNNRFDELMRLSRTELINDLQRLEIRLKELTDAMVKENPSPILEKLQAELLELQEKHTYLKECNSKLTAVLLQNESTTTECSENDIAPEILSLMHEDDHQKEHSDSEVYHECNESVEDAMTDLTAPKCDKNSLDASESNSGESKSNQNSNVKNSSEDSSEEDEEQQQETKLNLNSHIVQHCQTATSNSIGKDDIRTALGINNSKDLFHAKCSSSVPLEGGMSPSETSVN